MLKYPESTPCPVQTNSTHFTTSTFQPGEPTENIDFTTEIRAASRQAAPRKKKPFEPLEKLSSISARSNAAGRFLRSTGAPQTKELQVGPDKLERKILCHDSQSLRATTLGLKPARRQVSVLVSGRADESDNLTTCRQHPGKIDPQDVVHMRKKPRRRTIYVPSEDTTIFTIHPGIEPDARCLDEYSLSSFSPCNDEKPERLSSGSTQLQRRLRRPLATAPKRAPLQPMLKPLQESGGLQDTPGAGPGKENLPPGNVARCSEKGIEENQSRAKRDSVFGLTSGPGALPSDLASLPDRPSSNGLSKSRSEISFVNAGRRSVTHQSEKRVTHQKAKDSITSRRNSLYYGKAETAWKVAPHLALNQTTPKLPARWPAVPKETAIPRAQYPVLPEDISRTEYVF
ncbi:hypothetical protein MMC28_007803 [Mycoblastus sanguinarius]|nr:hypothetical protein [Mycoblastus sanguinarius]